MSPDLRSLILGALVFILGWCAGYARASWVAHAMKPRWNEDTTP
jgi:hypothetical protein